ncbi:hypothetical protein LIG30_1327 [Burkholderia sp. lig30]|jgi:hypothetical protein|nr:hypothetical protein [Burkholderia sp. lig30]KDB09587.1 hypothetical protein LIG30_1327 [Burkholderia sp. lig30]
MTERDDLPEKIDENNDVTSAGNASRQPTGGTGGSGGSGSSGAPV